MTQAGDAERALCQVRLHGRRVTPTGSAGQQPGQRGAQERLAAAIRGPCKVCGGPVGCDAA